MFGFKPTLVFVTIRAEDIISSDAILLYEGEWDSWKGHRNGIVIRKGEEFLLDGVLSITREAWESLPYVPRQYQILLNNPFDKTTGSYEGGFDGWGSSPQGVIIRKGNSFYLIPIVFLLTSKW